MSIPPPLSFPGRRSNGSRDVHVTRDTDPVCPGLGCFARRESQAVVLPNFIYHLYSMACMGKVTDNRILYSSSFSSPQTGNPDQDLPSLATCVPNA